MAATVKFGDPIFFTAVQQEMTEGNRGEAPDDMDVYREISRRSVKQMNASKLEALKHLNQLKEDWGNGVSTRIMIYNGMGMPIFKKSQHDSSGRWSTNELAYQIDPGEWAIGFHHKKSASATGSCGIVGYDLYKPGNQNTLMIGWETPWSGSNSAYCRVMPTSRWNSTSWDTLHEWTDDGPKSDIVDHGWSRTRFDTDSESSPTLTVVTGRNDT